MRPARLLTLLFASLLALPAQAAGLHVLASIRPLALVATAVGGERVEVQVLLPPGVSPHEFALRPSQRQQLAQADLVFWGGPALERPLTALLATRADTAIALEPRDLQRESHVWLEPQRTLAAAGRLAAALAQQDPAGAAYYQSRLALLRSQVLATETRLRASLAPVSREPLLLDHDFLDAFWPYFGLAEPLWIRRHPEQHPGTRHLLELADALANRGSVCYLREAGAPPEPLATGLGQRAVLLAREIDVLGVQMDVTTYPAWLQATGDTLKDCLQAAQAQNAGKKKP